MRLAPLAVVLLSGCAAAINVSGGAALTRDVGGSPAVEALLEARTRAAVQGMGLGIGARTRMGESGFDLGAGPEICGMPTEGYVQPSLCLGASLLTLGYRDGGLSLGAMSPYFEPGLAIPFGERSPNALFVSLPAGYDVRFTGPSAWYAGLTVGFGWSGNSGRLKRR